MVDQPIDLWLALMSVLPYLLLMAGVSGVFLTAFRRRQKRRKAMEQGPMQCPHCQQQVSAWLWENQGQRRYLCPECGKALDD